MSLFSVINGIVIGSLLLSSSYSFVLYLRRFEPKINLSYLFFSLILSFYVYINLESNFVIDFKEYILFDKLATAAITASSIFLILLIEHLTNYNSRVFRSILFTSLSIQLILNFIVPNGITFSEVTGNIEMTLFWGETLHFPEAKISPFIYFQIFLILLFLLFVFRSMQHLNKSGDKTNWKVLFFSMILGIVLVLVNTLFGLFHYHGFNILEKISFLSFTAIVSHRNFRNLIRTGEIQQELKMSEERFAHGY